MFKKKSKVAAIVLIIVLAVLSGCAKKIEEDTVQKTEIEKKIEYKEIAKPLQSALVKQMESIIQSLQKMKEKPDMDGAAGGDFWYEAYKAIIDDWTLIEEYGDFSYYSFYFGEDYGYDSYFLCDVDKNGIPELFLCSETTCITTVFTYANQLYWLTSDNIYGINEETSEIVVLGHWHGSGGSGTEYECTGWKVSDNEIEDSFYIDFYDFSENGDFIPEDGDESFYVIRNTEMERCEYTTNGTGYDELYAIHVKPCTLIKDYQLYDLSDSSGLDKMWRENCLNKNVLQTLNVDLEDAELIVTDCRYSAAVQWGYTDKESFIKDFGFEHVEPFYQYYEEDSGEVQLELYYDMQTGRGCGIRYYPGTDWKPEGFAFNGSDKNIESTYEAVKERMNANPYDTLAKGGIDLSQDMYIEDYEEELEYTSDGRLKHYMAQGWITYSSEEKEIQKLLEITLTYRDDGTLKQRDYSHNTFALETWESVSHSFYDKQERLLYEDCYITHGSMDYYYIYNEDETIPSYCLIMDHNLNLLCAELLSIHDITEDEYGKQYGFVE